METDLVETPPPPRTARQPGLAAAIGVIAMYFALQVLASGVIGLIVGVLGDIRLGLHGVNRKAVQATLQTAMTQPDARLLIVLLGLIVAAGLTLLLIRRCWPTLWSLAPPPGFGWSAPRRAGAYGMAAALGLVTPLLGGALTLLLAHGHPVTQDVKQMLVGTSPGMRVGLMLTVVSLGPLIEELLFRGVLLSALLRHVRAGWAIALSAVLFALAHLPDLGFLWYALPNLALLGVVAAWLRLRAGSIWPAVLAHAINNLFAVAMWTLGAN